MVPAQRQRRRDDQFPLAQQVLEIVVGPHPLPEHEADAQVTARRALGEAAFSRALGRGAAMDDDEITDYALGQFRRVAALIGEPDPGAQELPPGLAQPSRRDARIGRSAPGQPYGWRTHQPRVIDGRQQNRRQR